MKKYTYLNIECDITKQPMTWANVGGV